MTDASPTYRSATDRLIQIWIACLTKSSADQDSDGEQASTVEQGMDEVVAPNEQSADAGDADFFEAGGDSLGATRLLIAIKEEFQVDVPLEKFLEAPNFQAPQTLIAQQHEQLPGRAT